MSDSKAPPLTLTEWKEAAASLREERGLDANFAKEAQDAFARALIKQYWKPLYDAIMARTKQSEQIWSTIIGVNRTTAYRWSGDLVGQGDRRAKEPSLHHVVKSLAAFDLDGAILPRGLFATIEAYRETYAFVEDHLAKDGKKAGKAISTEEVLYLHLAIRSTDWCEACISNDAELQQKAAANLVRRVGGIVKEPTVGTFAGIQRILRDRFVPWSLLETVIVYEWIQS
jgi:hypothetical protein